MTSPIDRLAARFTPVPVRARADGWTPARQRGFVAALGTRQSVGAAAASVGMSRESAYRLADRPHARSFRRAWRIARELARPLAPERENLWGSHIHDRRPARRGGLATRPVSDGRLRVRMRGPLAALERATRAEHDRQLAALDARDESHSGGGGLPHRSGNFVTFGTDRPPAERHPLVARFLTELDWLATGEWRGPGGPMLPMPERGWASGRDDPMPRSGRAWSKPTPAIALHRQPPLSPCP